MRFVLTIILFGLWFQTGSRGAEPGAKEAIENLGGVVRSSGRGVSLEFHLGAREMGDEGLESVAKYQGKVVSLNLRDTKITSAGLVHLKDLSELRRLHLERTAVDDEGIAYLAGLTKLEYLNLYSTKVSDRSIAHLQGLKNLKQLFVWQTSITEAGCVRLERALPNLKIVRGVDLDKVAAEAREEENKVVERVDLKWVPLGVDDPPRSKTGTFTTVLFENKRDQPVKLYWVQYGGGLKFYADIGARKNLERNTFSDATWVITREDGSVLGYFISTLKPSRAVIPK